MITSGNASIEAHSRRLWIIALLIFCGWWVNLLELTHARRLHPDEAFYLTSARDAAIKGDWWLIGEPLDKPPLTHYANAVALVFLAAETDANGVLQLDSLRGEFAGRIVSLLASTLLIAVVAQLAYSLTRQAVVAYFAALLLAFSPLRIAFAATAFTDMPMLLLASISLLTAIRGQASLTGFWWALSLAAKPQSIFYLPLLLIFLLWRNPHWRLFWQFMIPVIVIVAILMMWDTLRVLQGGMSFYLLGQTRYTITTLTHFKEYGLRLATWWQTVQYSLGIGWLTIALSVISIWKMPFHDRRVQILVGWVLGFSALHITWTLNLFDRNQLILLPSLVLLVAMSLSGWVFRRLWLIAGVIVLCMFSAWWTIAGFVPLGGDDGRHDEIHRLAQFLNEKPVATIIYDRWLDWELDYYMGAWTNKRRVYYPTPETLVTGAMALPETGLRYIVIPVWAENGSDWIDTLRAAGFQPERVHQIAAFNVWSLTPP